jgi:hypothetical protein
LLVDVNGKRTAAEVETWDEEQQARIEFTLSHGATQCRFQYTGGVWVDVPRATPQPGATSRELRIRRVVFHGMELAIEAEIPADGESSLILETPWRIAAVEGGSAIGLAPGRTEIHFTPATSTARTGPYVTSSLHIELQQP